MFPPKCFRTPTPPPHVFQSPQAPESPLSLGGIFHQGPLTQTLLSGFRVGVFLQECLPYPCSPRPGCPQRGGKLVPVVIPWWISFLPETQSFSSSERETVPPRGAVICSNLENRKPCQSFFICKNDFSFESDRTKDVIIHGCEIMRKSNSQQCPRPEGVVMIWVTATVFMKEGVGLELTAW